MNKRWDGDVPASAGGFDDRRKSFQNRSLAERFYSLRIESTEDKIYESEPAMGTTIRTSQYTKAASDSYLDPF